MNENTEKPDIEITINEKIEIDKDGNVSNYEGQLTMMREIEVSDEVIGNLETRRTKSDETYNDILRRFLGM